MTPQQVEERLCQLKNRKPFVPFVVELTDGQLLEVHTRGIAINAGGAGFFGADGALTDFEFANVRDIRFLSQESAA